MHPARVRSAAVLDALKRYRRIRSDSELARLTGIYNRGVVQAHRTGRHALDVEKIAVFAAALDVNPIVFLMEPDEAIAWTVINRPNHF